MHTDFQLLTLTLALIGLGMCCLITVKVCQREEKHSIAKQTFIICYHRNDLYTPVYRTSDVIMKADHFCYYDYRSLLS